MAQGSQVKPRQRITIPYCPRVWARRAHESFRRWLVIVLHRRAGKTTFELNHHQRAALDDQWERARLRHLLPEAPESQLQTLLKRRTYWHVMPTYKQAKLVAWEPLKDFARVVPGVKFNESELRVDYPNGNRLQLIGGDDPDALRGPGLSGLSLDEFSQIPESAFGEVLSKALADHLGYCIWSGTIQGEDQLYALYQNVKENPEWFALWQNIDVSLETEHGATITALRRAMDDDRRLVADGVMTQDEFDQEWYLSPAAAVKGAWYRKEMAAAQAQRRITQVPYDGALPVDTDWDLGIGDLMAIWFSQTLPSGEVRLIDYLEADGEGLAFYVKALREKPYVYGKHWAPHDIRVRELGTGKSRLEVAAELGLRFEVTPALPLEDGISATRAFLRRCWFDEQACKVGLSHLRNYRKRFNSSTQEFSDSPVHDRSSHAADAFRGLVMRHREDEAESKIPMPPPVSPSLHWSAI